MKVKEISFQERPREKAFKFGIKVLSNRELLALLIRSGYQKQSALDIADNLLREYGSLRNCLTLDLKELMKHKGIKIAKGLEILATIELAKRMMYEDVEQKDIVTSPSSLISWLKLRFGDLQQEHFVVVFLNTKNCICDYEIISKGGLDSANVHPREVFKKAIKIGCAKIICAHNHPSFDVTPSNADIEVTKKLVEASKMLNIFLVDHVIVGPKHYYSFKENNLIAN